MRVSKRNKKETWLNLTSEDEIIKGDLNMKHVDTKIYKAKLSARIVHDVAKRTINRII